MSARRLLINEPDLTVEIRIDDDFPAEERPVEVWLGDPYSYSAITPDEAERIGRALIAAAKEARKHQAECPSGRWPSDVKPKPLASPPDTL